MPTSRNRKARNRSSRSRARDRARAAAGRARAGAYGLSARELGLMERSAAAEAAGDPRLALALLDQVPALGHGPHRLALRELVEAGPSYGVELPGWVWSRWVLGQALRHAGPGSMERRNAAMEAAARCYAPGDRRLADVWSVVAQLCGQDWVYRQLLLFEYGGVTAFLDEAASPELVARADHMTEWADAPVRAFRLHRARGAEAELVDIATDEVVTVLDIGSMGEMGEGECMLGRLVPIEDAPGAMFESRPLPVPAAVASGMASDVDDWRATVADAHDNGTLADGWSSWDPGSLCTDVPELVWRLALVSDLDKKAAEQLAARHLLGDTSRAEDAVLLLTAVLAAMPILDERARLDIAPLAAAALMAPGAADAIWDQLSLPQWEQSWWALARLVAPPARDICGEYAVECARFGADVS